MRKVLMAPKMDQKSSQKKRISVCIPQGMLKELTEHLAANNEQRKRSEWIEQAVVELIKQKKPEGFVMEDWIERGENTIVQVWFHASTYMDLMLLVKRVESIADNQRDLVSAVVRTAITLMLVTQEAEFCISSVG